METKPINPAGVATPANKGSIIALLLIILSLVLYFTGQIGNRNLRSLQFVILFVGVLLSSIYYAKQMDGNVTFGNVFAEGFKTTAVVIVLFSIYTIVAMKLVLPGMTERIIEAARAEAQSAGNATLEEFDKNVAVTKQFLVPITIGIAILSFGITGALGALVGAAVRKKTGN